MLDKKDFESIRNDLEQFENQRENVIRAARKVIQLSKRIIYSVHRGDLQIEPLIKEIKTAVKSLPEKYYDTDIDRVAVQEYVEAVCYYEFIKSRRMPTRKDLGVLTELYLLGLCDLTGELVRKAVFASINKDYKLVLEIKELV